MTPTVCVFLALVHAMMCIMEHTLKHGEEVQVLPCDHHSGPVKPRYHHSGSVSPGYHHSVPVSSGDYHNGQVRPGGHYVDL